MTLCSDEHCTGNHHGYPNLCPRSVRNSRDRKRAWTEERKEQDRARRRAYYDALDGMAYAHLLLKHRRTKALHRIDKRRH